MFTRLLSKRTIVTTPPLGFTYISSFLDKQEQFILTKAALNHLDGLGTNSARRTLKRALAAGLTHDQLGFLPEEECYQFEEVSNESDFVISMTDPKKRVILMALYVNSVKLELQMLNGLLSAINNSIMS